MKKIIPLLFIVALAPLKSQAAFKSLSAGVNYPTVQGRNYTSMQRQRGYELSTNAHTDAFNDFQLFGFKPLKWVDTFDMKFTAFYQPYSLFGKTNANLNMIGGLAGFETKGTQHNFLLHPFLYLQVGSIYSWLNFPAATGTSHSQYYFMARAGLGFEAPIWKGLNLVIDSPISVIPRNIAPLVVWNLNASARWRFE